MAGGCKHTGAEMKQTCEVDCEVMVALSMENLRKCTRRCTVTCVRPDSCTSLQKDSTRKLAIVRLGICCTHEHQNETIVDLPGVWSGAVPRSGCI